MEEHDPIIGGEPPRPEAPADGSQELAASLKAALAASVPGLDPALIGGESAEEIDASFATLREALNAARPAVAVPAGAPGRTVAPPSTPFAKIREGLARL